MEGEYVLVFLLFCSIHGGTDEALHFRYAVVLFALPFTFFPSPKYPKKKDTTVLIVADLI